VLPLGNPDDPLDVLNAAAEARRALTGLGMDGIGLYSNYNGAYPGDPRFAPLFETLNELGAMVFLHPVTPAALPQALTSKITFLYEFPFDTTRAVVNMLYWQVFTLYPNIRWLIAHAGGAIPFLAYRTSLLTVFPALGQNLAAVGLPYGGLQDGASAYAGLYYDTALSPAPSAMRAVRAVTDVSHVMFATDWPFSAPVFIVPGNPAPQLAESFDAQELRQVERGNALAQFPRIAAQLAAA
jgi:predicted TIM-barrel fold metal-dependent hydrolase